MAIVNKNPEYFLTIAKEGNISKAAEQLYVSQSYLSQYISKLESSFDVKLLDRSKTPIELTEAGKIYANYLQTSNRLYSKLTADFDALNRQRANTLNIGIAPWRGSTLLPEILPLFIMQNRNVKIYLYEYPVRHLFDLIDKNSIDIAVMNVSFDKSDAVNVEFLTHERIFLVANRRHPLTSVLKDAMRKDGNLDWSLLEDECFILIKRGMSCAEWIYNYLENVNFTPQRQIVTSSKATAFNLVAQNMGFAFMPEVERKWVAHAEDMEFIDLHTSDLVVPLAVVYKKDTFLSVIAQNFIECLKGYYARRGSSGDE